MRPSTWAGGLAVWSTRARGTARRAACWCRGACGRAWTRGGSLERVVLTRAGGAGLARRLAAVVRRGRRGSARRAPCARAVRPDRGGARSRGRAGAACQGGEHGRAGYARVSQTGHGARAGSAWHGCSAARGKRRGGPGRRWSGRAGSEREEGGARSTGAERAERRGVARSGRAAEEEGSECASAAKAECAGQGRHARPGTRARGAVARAAGANCGRRSRDETVAREKRESEVRPAKKER